MACAAEAQRLRVMPGFVEAGEALLDHTVPEPQDRVDGLLLQVGSEHCLEYVEVEIRRGDGPGRLLAICVAAGVSGQESVVVTADRPEHAPGDAVVVSAFQAQQYGV